MGGVDVVKKKIEVMDIVAYTFLTLSALVILLPMMYVVTASVTSYEDMIRGGGIVLFPKSINLDGYKSFLNNKQAFNAYRNTIFVTVVGTALSTILTILVAYPISRKDMPRRGLFTVFFFIPMIISGGLIPTFLVVKATCLTNTLWAMIIPDVISTFNLMIMKSFFQGLDTEYIEAARIDGAGEFKILFKIVVPLSLPVICTVLLFYGVSNWNTFYSAIYYVPDPNKQTLQVLLRNVIASSEFAALDVDVNAPSFTLKMAAVVLTALPIVVLYPFLQKYFIQGVTLGGVKG